MSRPHLPPTARGLRSIPTGALAVPGPTDIGAEDVVELLLDLCIRTSRGETPHLPRRLTGATWTVLYLLACRTDTVTLLDHALRECSCEAPPWIIRTCRDMRLSARALGAHRRTDICRLLDSAGLHQVRYALRKGLAIIDAYPAIEYRPFRDIDVLVHPDDLGELQRALRTAGCSDRVLSRRAALYLRIATRSTSGMRCTGLAGTTDIDISTSVLLRRSDDRATATAFLEARRTVRGLPVLGPAQRLLDIAYGLYVTSTTLRYVQVMRFQRLVPYLDILLAASNMTLGDWAGFDQLIDTLGLHDVVDFAFGNFCRLFPSEDVAERLRGRCASETRGCDQFATWESAKPLFWPTDIRGRLLMTEVPPWVPEPSISF